MGAGLIFSRNEYRLHSMHIKRYLIPGLMMILLAALVFGMKEVQAQDIIAATLNTEAENLTVGDPIRLTLSVTHAADQTVILPQLESDWGDFIVHSQAPAETITNPDETKTTSQVIDVRLFATGTFTTPPLTVKISDSSGQISEVTAEPISLVINSVLVAGDPELRDIKPQAELPYTNLTPWIIAGMVIVGVLGAAVIWRRKRQTSLDHVIVDPRLPHDVALEELQRIGKMGLPESGRYKEHYSLVSDCMRIYVERTLQTPVMERTTSEIRSGLRDTIIPSEVSQQLLALLDECDLVKFSEITPDAASAYQLLEIGRQIVADTKPAADPIDEGNKPVGKAPSDYTTDSQNRPSEVST
jgi:hypothetical protein